MDRDNPETGLLLLAFPLANITGTIARHAISVFSFFHLKFKGLNLQFKSGGRASEWQEWKFIKSRGPGDFPARRVRSGVVVKEKAEKVFAVLVPSSGFGFPGH